MKTLEQGLENISDGCNTVAQSNIRAPVEGNKFTLIKTFPV